MTDPELIFEESLSDDWAGDLEVVEVPLNDKPLIYLGLVMFLIGALIAGRVFFLNVVKAGLYDQRAETNAGKYERISAPRGLIQDRTGITLAENVAVFSAYLNVAEYIRNPDLSEKTLAAIQNILDIPSDEVLGMIEAWDPERSGEPVLLTVDITQSQLVALKSLDLPTLIAQNSFRRSYPGGPVFSSVTGYVGLTTPKDLAQNPELSHQDYIGKTGLELSYDDSLRGKAGVLVKLRDAHGNILNEQEKNSPQIGQTLHLTIDADFQKYFHDRMLQGLNSLGRTSGVALAMNPRTGEILALVNFPTFDNNVFSASGHGEERKAYLTSPTKPMFGRVTTGAYNPGSTIKPLVGVAALAEKVINPERSIFSPGYLDLPNPYDPDHPSRFLDWRYQGEVNLYSALAQSSNVYFYEVGGGFGDIKGLGIDRLRTWWQKFGLGQATGIDLPGELSGFLPSIEWKQKMTGRPWLVGDTYNISIGQGDLLVTPIQLLNYISAIANGGTLYKPTLNKDLPREVLSDLTYLGPQIKEVEKGMRLTVTSPMGTAHALRDLPFEAAAKTGSAQIRNNQAENAFFVGYAPYADPRIAILVLVENSREGSLNAVPIAKDVLNWYYLNRLKNTSSVSRDQ